MDIHKDIKSKLNYFKSIHKIPNIIFHGPSGSGKRTIVHEFINDIYENDKSLIKSFVLNVNCAHGKGIKFIREDLKFFAKTHINSKGGDLFKSVILLNADKLTVDAQSALRRCIELFSHNTRFFIIVEDKFNLLKPILSRFCDIYISLPHINSKYTNLYIHNMSLLFQPIDFLIKKKNDWLTKELKKLKQDTTISKILFLSEKIYEKGYSAIELLDLLKNTNNLWKNTNEKKKYELLFTFHNIKKQIRSEKILIMFILNFVYLSLESSLENISFM
jgi:hypothetical protein